jgi:hypothetical protein
MQYTIQGCNTKIVNFFNFINNFGIFRILMMFILILKKKSERCKAWNAIGLSVNGVALPHTLALCALRFIFDDHNHFFCISHGRDIFSNSYNFHSCLNPSFPSISIWVSSWIVLLNQKKVRKKLQQNKPYLTQDLNLEPLGQQSIVLTTAPLGRYILSRCINFTTVTFSSIFMQHHIIVILI